MTARIIDGKAYAEGLRARVAGEVKALASEGITPGLAVVLVGNDPASEVYVRNKVKFSEEVGIRSTERKLPADVSEAELIAEIERLNADPTVHGILVQLPLPKHIREAAAIQSVRPEKDVDGFHVINAGKLATGLDGLVPCTPAGCLMLIKDAVPKLAGKRALVIGRSNIVGKPMAMLLLRESCTVTIAHSRTENLPELCRQADIVVAAVGQAEMVKSAWIKPGAVVIDVGMNRVTDENGKSRLTGDVDYAEAVAVAGAITPVPGGVGPMTIACLLANTVKAARGLLDC